MRNHIYESDYGGDFLRWAKIYEPIKFHKVNYNHDPLLEEIQESIVKNNDAGLACFFAHYFQYKNYKMQGVVLKAREPKYAFLFAATVPNADIQSLQSVVVDLNKIEENIKYICHFACHVSGADKKKIESIILKSEVPKYAHMFIKHIDGVNIHKFKHIIMTSKKPRYLYELAQHTKSRKDISKIEDLIIASGSATYIRLFAENIEGANLEKLEEAILEIGDTEAIKKFAKFVKKSKLRNLSILF